MGIFDKRISYKPFEYPEVMQYTEAINKAYWVHSEIDFTADIQDFHSHLSPIEKNAVKSALLAIAQIEVNVKSFWGNLYHHVPKPEFNGLGATFAECEFRHSEAYSRLLEVLGYSDEFEDIIEVPVIRERIQYLSEALSKARSNNPKEYTMSLVLFSLLIENVSLFSQFAIILSFTRFKGLMKNVSNIIAWTSVDEQIHANAGIYIYNTIKKENPEMIDEEFKADILRMVKKSIEVEEAIIEWIFREGELEKIKKEELVNFMKVRTDDSLRQIGFSPIFNIDASKGNALQWFEEEVFANSMDDFFAKRPVDYTKFDKSISANDLF